jgi:hypothetical protein
VVAAERVRLRIGNLAKAVLVSGQAYQDPKDALNEFVSNAADEYVEAGRTGERVRIVLRRKGRRTTDLPSVAPDPDPGEARSRFDHDAGVVFYNDRHADYLLVKNDEATLLDYLATLVAKEYVLYNNPRAANDEFAEEMVRMLVGVRRHLLKPR